MSWFRSNEHFLYIMTRDVHQPGIEPGANEWEPFILPLNHWCEESGSAQEPHTTQHAGRKRQHSAETVDRTRDLQIDGVPSTDPVSLV